MQNLKNQLFQKKWLLLISAVLIISSLFAVNYLWLNGTFGISPFKNRSLVVINGGSLASVATAIQLSDLQKNFILIEPNNVLGGQATAQGVSTFDQHNRPFQYSKLYSEFLQNMQVQPNFEPSFRTRDESFGIDYWGNAITGPGALPTDIVKFLESRINPDYGRVIYNSEIINVYKVGNKIDSVLIKNKETQKTQRLQADFFIDAGDFSEISRLAQIPFNFGMDTQEQTGEKLALTEKELDIFKNGVSTTNGIVGNFGNRLQPITTPFALLDKGYNGNRYSASRIASFSSQDLIPKPCPKNIFQCLEIASGQDLQFEFKQPKSGLLEVNFVFANNLIGFRWLNNVELKLGDKVYTPQELGANIYKPNDQFTILKFPFDSRNSTIKANFSNSLGESLYLSEVIISPLNQNNKTLSATLDQVKRVARYQTNFESAGQKKDDKSYKFNLENWMVEPNQNYYLTAVFPKELNFDKLSRRFAVNIFEDGNKIFDVVIDPNNNYFDGYFPFFKFTGFEAKGYSISFIGLDKKEPPLESLLILPASQITSFEMLKDKESLEYNQTDLVDVVSIGAINNLGVSLETKTDDQNQTKTDTLIKNIRSNPSTRVRFIARKFINQGDIIRVNSESNSSQILIIKANPAHFHNQVYDNFEIDQTKQDQKDKSQAYFYPIDPGKYQILARVKQTDNPNDKVDFSLKLANQDEQNDTITFTRDKFQSLAFAKIDQDTINFRLTPTCQNDCLQNLEIILTEEIPPQYDAEFFNNKVTYRSGEKLIFSENDIVKDFFRFRRVLDPDNFFRNPNIPPYIKSRVNFNSLGVSQINTGFNDLEMESVDPERLLNDENYRAGIFYRSRLLSAQYYYWLKYDAPKPLLGCKDQEPFCSSLRLSLSSEGMGTEDGLAKYPYIRDPVRNEAEKRITFNDISVKANPCSSDQCVNLKLDGIVFEVDYSFLQKLTSKPIAPFYYPTDIHRLVQDAKPFYNYLIENNFRTQDTFPEHIFGIYDSAIKSGTIDLGNLFNSKIDNLLFCGKNISTTQIANGSTRLHPAEVAVGQACAITTSYLIDNQISKVNDIYNDTDYRKLQQKLVENGAVLVPLDDSELITLVRQNRWQVLLAYYGSLIDGYLDMDISQDKVNQFVLLKILPNQKASQKDLQQLTTKLGWSSSNQQTQDQEVKLLDLYNLAPENSKNKIQELVSFHRTQMKEAGLDTDYQIDGNYLLTRGDLAMVASEFAN
jgi:hypothetical protein